MKHVKTKHEVRATVSGWKAEGKKVAFVPTMGALHQGHLALINKARALADHVVVSVFVNPTQFGPEEDFDKYPRPLEHDLDKCRKEGVSLVFVPERSEMYGREQPGKRPLLTFSINRMNEHLCGNTRKGHFEGVLQVVCKLLNIVQPDFMILGQKDIQQYFIIRQMAEEFDFPVEVKIVPTQRDKDGLALSSRNVYLSKEDRAMAPMLFDAIQKVSRRLMEGFADDEINDGEDQTIEVDSLILSKESERLRENGFNVDYLSLVTTPDLQPAETIQPGRLYVIAVA
ncbi:pantoate--beta-alanine ligase, partial [Balneolaceae bacterium ANBcel3]|nr:pantoate--beta-alanine ligase [Balneolaceae bacterium ANBcel3]